MSDFLSAEWLEANLFNAESMPDDRIVPLIGKEWFALLMEINRLRKTPDPNATVEQHALELAMANYMLSRGWKQPVNQESEWHDPGVAHVAVNGGLELDGIMRIFSNEKNWDIVFDRNTGKAVWAWKGPIVPPFDLATWAKKESKS
jgi:hypothetical protein